jgi:Domain of unknown function (DUF4124)
MHICKGAFVLITLILTVSTGFSDTLYKWIDAQGVQRFSNHPPPPDVKTYETIEGAPKSPAGDDQREEFKRMMQQVEKENRRNDAEARQREIERAKEDKRNAAIDRKARIQARCRRLQRRIDEIKKRGLGPNFTPGMRKAQIDQIQKQIDALEKTVE